MKQNYIRRVYTLGMSVLFSLLLVPSAFAQLSGNDAFLKGQYVEVGVSRTGSFGSEGAAPAGYHPNVGSQLGFVADADQNGFNVGTPPYSGDYFVPGTPEEGWGIQVNGSNYYNAALMGEFGIPASGPLTYASSASEVSATWTGGVAGLEITQRTYLPLNALYFVIQVKIKNTTGASIPNVYYFRNVDPDNEQPWTGVFTTRNTVVFQPPATCAALVEAEGLQFGQYVGLGTKDLRAKVTHGGFSNRSASDIYNGSGFSQSGTATADIAISLAYNLGTLAAGQEVTLSYAYVLNRAQLDAALEATATPTFTANGTDITASGTYAACAGTSVNLVISNVSGYDWSWSPADDLNTTTGQNVTSTPTQNRTYTVTGTPSSSASGCGTGIITKEITITLLPLPVAGTVSPSSSTVCSGTSIDLSLSGQTGAIQWQSSPDNVTFTDISGQTGTTLNTGPLSSTTYFRAEVSSGDCGEVYSNVATVTISAGTSFISAPVLPQGQNLCADALITFSFGTSGTCPFPAGNVFTAQLSDGAGNFGSPVSLGPVTPGSNTVRIPFDTPSGNNYRIRVVSSNPVVTGAPSSVSFKVKGLAFTSYPVVHQSPVCVGTTFTVSFTTNCPFPSDNTFTVELSDASGSFASPLTLGTVSPGINNPVPMPQNLPAGTGYRVRIRADVPSLVSAQSAPFQVKVPSFASTPTVSGAAPCPGGTVRLTFSTGCVFFPENTFTAELSNASGSFASPTPLGTVSPGMNNVTIPMGTPAGTGYKIRVVSSNPSLTSNASSGGFQVKSCGTLGREIAPEEQGLRVSVSPNPSPEGRLRIAIAGAEGQALKVELFNGTGRTLRQQRIERAAEEDVLEWDIARQPEGLYLLRVSGAKEVKTVKVIH